MTPEVYAKTQTALARIAEILACMPLEEFLEMARRAESVGAVVDPTLYRQASPALEKVIEIADAALVLKQVRLAHRVENPLHVQMMNRTAGEMFLEMLMRL